MSLEGVTLAERNVFRGCLEGRTCEETGMNVMNQKSEIGGSWTLNGNVREGISATFVGSVVASCEFF